MNPYYVLCASHPEVDKCHLRTRYGQFIVRINDPLALLERIETVWSGHALASGHAVIEPVEYNKGALLEPTPGLLPPIPYSYAQKPASFHEDMEYRYVLTCTADIIKLGAFSMAEGRTAGHLEDHLTLFLPDCSDICSLT